MRLRVRGALEEHVEASVAPGERVLDALDELRAPVRLSCRAASCGICRVRILDGASLLEPPEADERETLALFDADPGDRLACQARLRREARTGALELEAIEPLEAVGAGT